MSEKTPDEIVPIVIDLNVAANGQLNESFLGMFGSWIQTILGRMFGGAQIPVSVRGTPSQIKTFANALQKEKKFIEVFNSNGLNNPQTYRSKANLKNAVGKFERATGIKWPFK